MIIMNIEYGIGETKDVIFNNDPLYMLSLIGKNVQVQLVDNVTYTGIVYVIDPVYKNLIIHERSSESYLVTRIILYQAIKLLTVLSDERIESYVNGTELLQVAENVDVNHKKTLLKNWFQHMCLHVEESGDFLKIDDNVVIVPPYGPENCICNNTLILERIKNMIMTMPNIESTNNEHEIH